MRYRDAKKLRHEDEAIRKSDGRALSISQVDVDAGTRTVTVRCNDGNWYGHRKIK